MLKHTIAAIALTFAAAPALAQSDSGAAAGAATGAVGGAIVGGPVGAVVGAGVGAVAGGALGSISAQDRTYVREYVVQHKRPSARVQGDVVVGATLPQQVAVYPVEGNAAFSNYRYTYVNGRAVLVDPSSRRVVYVID
jgi:phage tail tape-measure protein